MNKRYPFGIQWWSLGFSVIGCVVLTDPLQRHANATETVLSSLGVAVFIALYVSAVVAWKRRATGLWQTIGIGLLGVLFAPFNSLAWIFFVVASAFSAWVAAGDIRKVALIVLGLITTAVTVTLMLHLRWSFATLVALDGVPTALICTLTLRRAIAVRELARHGERERIARDMHDVLGHTLSVIILKADLAARLAHQSPDRAVDEMADVNRIARDTLEEVRQTLRGYRARSLEHEFELAKNTLAIAGLTVTGQFDPPPLAAGLENILCLALREGVTNVVRHSQAQNCRVSVIEDDGKCRLEIEDDGRGIEERPEPAEGQGLRGMRERVEANGGTIAQRPGPGTMLTITLPLIADAAGAGDFA